MILKEELQRMREKTVVACFNQSQYSSYENQSLFY
jgi:hypothetical protein